MTFAAILHESQPPAAPARESTERDCRVRQPRCDKPSAPGAAGGLTVLWRNRERSPVFDPLPGPEPLPEIYIEERMQWLNG